MERLTGKFAIELFFPHLLTCNIAKRFWVDWAKCRHFIASSIAGRGIRTSRRVNDTVDAQAKLRLEKRAQDTGQPSDL